MPARIVIMGVSGCGKTEIGRRLAARLGVAFRDADDYHSPANVAKMAGGAPLTDADRAAWLDDLAALLARHDALVLACSALKHRYRARLSHGVSPPPAFIFLDGAYETIRERLDAREGHYFAGVEMLKSQFDALEPPDPAQVPHVAIDAPVEDVVTACARALGLDGGAAHPRADGS